MQLFTIYLFISVRRSTCFRRFFRPSSGAQYCTYSVRYWSDKYLTLYVQFWAPDDGRKPRLKHVEGLTEINKLWNVASCWLYSENLFMSSTQLIVQLENYNWGGDAVHLCVFQQAAYYPTKHKHTDLTQWSFIINCYTFRLSRSILFQDSHNSNNIIRNAVNTGLCPFTFFLCIWHLPDDGWTWHPQHVAVYNNRILC